MEQLAGREAERARVGALASAAREGASGALLVLGDPGIGKSALLEHAAARAQELTVLRARGVASEAELPFAGLHELLRPVLDRLDDVPGPQAQAVRAALALDPSEGPDRFTVYAGVLSLLGAAAPALVLVDDAQWLDAGTTEALAFSARRLAHEGVAMAIAARAPLPAALDGAGIEVLALGPLPLEAARAALAALDPSLAGLVRDAVCEAAVGNPLALREIVAALPPAVRRAEAPLPVPLPGSASLERAFLDRVLALSVPARAAALVAALCETEDVSILLAAAGALGADAAAFEEAEAAGLVALDGATVRFPTPVARSAASAAAEPSVRRAAHRAIADAVEARAPDLAAWHRAAAAIGPDGAIADALDHTADEALARGGYAAAFRARARAAELTPEPARRARRLRRAGEDGALAGRPDAALDLLARALALDEDGTDRTAIAHARGRISTRAGDAAAAVQVLVDEAERIGGRLPHAAAQLLAEAVPAALRAGEPRRAVELGQRAHALAGGSDGAVRATAELMVGTALAFVGDPSARAHVEAAAQRDQDEASFEVAPQLRAYLGAAFRAVGEHDRARAVLDAVIADARARSAPGVLPYALARRAAVDLEEGRWASAEAALDEAAALALATGQEADRGIALATRAWLDAARGREDACRAHADAALDVARSLGQGGALDHARAALALLDLGAGRMEEAAGHLDEALRVAAAAGWSDAAVPPFHAPDLVEALVRAGRAAEAVPIAERFAAEATLIGRADALAAAARCRALVADGEDGDRLFAEAIALHGAGGSPFELARTRLAYAERLRRAARRVDARAELRLAHEAFDGLGAAPWAQRAESELRATGEVVRRREAGALDELTPHELQIATVIAEGITNREAAARLFLSQKTIEFHLGRIFRKLGIRSRTELAQLLARDPALGTGAAGAEH